MDTLLKSIVCLLLHQYSLNWKLIRTKKCCWKLSFIEASEWNFLFFFYFENEKEKFTLKTTTLVWFEKLRHFCFVISSSCSISICGKCSFVPRGHDMSKRTYKKLPKYYYFPLWLGLFECLYIKCVHSCSIFTCI